MVYCVVWLMAYLNPDGVITLLKYTLLLLMLTIIPSSAFAHGLPDAPVMVGMLVVYLMLHFGSLFYMVVFSVKHDKASYFILLTLLAIVGFWSVLTTNLFQKNSDTWGWFFLLIPPVLSVILFFKRRMLRKHQEDYNREHESPSQKDYDWLCPHCSTVNDAAASQCSSCDFTIEQ